MSFNTPFPAGRRRWVLALVLLGALVAGAALWWRDAGKQPGAGGGGKAGAMQRGPQPVTAAAVTRRSLDVWLPALGTVTPRSLVNVMPRVSGLLQSIDFHQGQRVRAGQLLATIDAQPFRIALQQAQAQREQTAAQLAGAERDLQRFETLLRQDAIAEQQVSDQRATVAQLKAQLDSNAAQVANARLQLQWTRITAPVAGIVGLRQVDAGNMVGTSGAIGVGASAGTGTGTGTGASPGSGATPIVSIAQVQPVEVTFALPQQQAAQMIEQLAAGRHPQVQAWDAGNTRMLAEGTLLATDNQISTSTGTLAMRAEFANRDLALFPNQFVNVRVLARSLPGAVVVPSTAVGIGAPGSYVFVLGGGDRVSLRKVSTGVAQADLTQITAGLQAGERVVTDGLDRLRDGAAVRVVRARSAASAPKGAGHSAASAE